MSWCSISSPAISASDTATPLAYSRSHHSAVTARPLGVAVPRMYPSITSGLRSGTPAQLMLIGPNSRCSTGFHFDAPVG